MRPNNAMAASVWDFNVCTDVDAHDCTRGLHGHCKRVCTGSWLWERNPLPHLGLKPASVLHLAFPLDSLQTELFLPLKRFYMLLFAGSVFFSVCVCYLEGGGVYGQLFVLKHCQRVQKRCAYPPSICVEPGAKQMLLWYVGVPVHWQVIQLQQLQSMADEQVHASATVQDQTGARQNNNNNAHLSSTHQCNERSLDTY